MACIAGAGYEDTDYAETMFVRSWPELTATFLASIGLTGLNGSIRTWQGARKERANGLRHCTAQDRSIGSLWMFERANHCLDVVSDGIGHIVMDGQRVRLGRTTEVTTQVARQQFDTL